MADEKTGVATAIVPSPSPSPAAPDPRDQAIRTAIADLGELGASAVERGDLATMERVRGIAEKLAAARPKA